LPETILEADSRFVKRFCEGEPVNFYVPGPCRVAIGACGCPLTFLGYTKHNVPVIESPIELPIGDESMIGGKCVYAIIRLDVWDVAVLGEAFASQNGSASDRPLEVMVGQTSRSWIRGSHEKSISGFHLPGGRIRANPELLPNEPTRKEMTIVAWAFGVSGVLWGVNTMKFPKISS
jgi:hypothetical protein